MERDTFLVYLVLVLSGSHVVGAAIYGFICSKQRDKLHPSIEVCRLRMDEMTVKLGVVLSILGQFQANLPKPSKLPADGIVTESAFRQKPME